MYTSACVICAPVILSGENNMSAFLLWAVYVIWLDKYVCVILGFCEQLHAAFKGFISSYMLLINPFPVCQKKAHSVIEDKETMLG